ncbi:anaerobic nitric oxide reductase flavorubredoxin [Herbinix luporum]|jgi:flavorubredoxin|uniref:anaerobic nitric oxide reductase flavorubredoxin n=1 Tax=Herbinix luporum TaxID=1679721 RepID=UPI001773F047|nr:anaerobic nitric oxide reductase flavorubredoxin [Herbinix luporum]MDI9488688.1 anaerobic nitric oxide reductase flavorubredoxin [Bacillota bacterium]HHT56729.1 anaerobic nitric oxide reductase flavorubredoxin [Herbinix luporum]
MRKRITDKVTWVGKVDWELKSFHGPEYSTNKGSSYNSYLIRDEKTVLIDTVWLPYDNEFVQNLENEIDLNKIDYIVVNHSEIDHSGALPELMRKIPNTPIYCTANGAKILKGHFHQDWNFVTVKTGDTLNIGSSTLTFVEAPMLHWPDSMMTYMSGENILFSNDAFGQHYATESLYNDKVDNCELFAEAIKYYANILTPFSRLVTKKIQEVLSFNLPLDMICTSHGVIWKNEPVQIVEKYLEWANDYQENQITLIYDTMWNSTRIMAESIAEGIMKADPQVTVKIYNSSKEDKNDIITEIFKSKAILVGSPTVNNGLLNSIAGLLEMIKGLKFKNKKAAAFGSYGWSGEVVKQINQSLKEAGFELVNEGIRSLWVPDNSEISSLIDFGKLFIEQIK